MQPLKLDRPGFESQFCPFLHVCPWTCVLTPLSLSFIFWAMEGMICPQGVV